jgi:hypothetical protein
MMRSFDEIGFYVDYNGKEGPCIYGGTEFVPNSSSLEERILAVIGCRESPLRNPKDKTRMAHPLRPSLNCIQAYEWTDTHGYWASMGLCHAITRNGNAQKLLGEIFDNFPELEEYFNKSGYFLLENSICVAGKVDELDVIDYYGEPYSKLEGSDYIKNESLLLVLYDILGDARTKDTQVKFFWKLISERDKVLKEMGWLDAVNENKRLRLLTASLAINASVGLMKECLRGAKSKTPEALTESRIAAYRGKGKERAVWELNVPF